MLYDVAIVGGGPAGASAAIFASKAGKKTLLVDADKGMTRRAMVRNHYGLPEISGPDLVETGHRQATALGAEAVKADVTDVRRKGEVLEIVTGSGTYQARHVILATGAIVDLAQNIGLATRAGTEPRIRSVVVVDPAGRTGVPGIWAAGTVAGASVHTIITAGDGARVAVNVVSDLNGSRWVDHDVLKA